MKLAWTASVVGKHFHFCAIDFAFSCSNHCFTLVVCVVCTTDLLPHSWYQDSRFLDLVKLVEQSIGPWHTTPEIRGSGGIDVIETFSRILGQNWVVNHQTGQIVDSWWLGGFCFLPNFSEKGEGTTLMKSIGQYYFEFQAYLNRSQVPKWTRLQRTIMF